MKKLLVLLGCVSISVGCLESQAFSAETKKAKPEDRFFSAYSQMSGALKRLEKDPKSAEALAELKEAEVMVRALQDDEPVWQSDVVAYRLRVLSGTISEVEAGTYIPKKRTNKDGAAKGLDAKQATQVGAGEELDEKLKKFKSLSQERERLSALQGEKADSQRDETLIDLFNELEKLRAEVDELRRASKN